jgi:uncharacterized membrane protein YphA (DoxX/SURF4 family)
MQILILIALLIGGGLFSLSVKPIKCYVKEIGTGFMILSLLLSFSSWIFYFAGITNTFLVKTLSFILGWGNYVFRFILGYLIVYIFLTLKSAACEYKEVKNTISLTLWGVSIITGNIFLIATVGKAENMTEMISFFKSSGYATWFLYFIMAAETLGATGILLHFKLKTGPWAAAGLMLIMFGAFYTHWHNHDPLSDSYAAISQLITLTIILILYRFENRVQKLANYHLNQPAI